jgi:hypothetical protein
VRVEDVLEQADKLSAFRIGERCKQFVLGFRENLVEAAQCQSAGSCDGDRVSATVDGVDRAFDETLLGKLRNSDGDVAAVEKGPTRKRGLAGRTEFVEGRKKSEVMSSQLRASEGFGEQAVGPQRGLAQKPAGRLSQPDGSFVVDGAGVYQLSRWPDHRSDTVGRANE